MLSWFEMLWRFSGIVLVFLDVLLLVTAVLLGRRLRHYLS
jgi:hypothetical protein